jgi:hypothetical protein
MARAAVIIQCLYFLLFANYANAQETTKVNVKILGAKGDGLTNDTKAIKEAFAQLHQTGGEIYFPEGNYLTDIIDIRPAEGIHIDIIGEKNTSIIKRAEDQKDVALFFCEIPNVILTFRSLKLNGSSTSRLSKWSLVKNEHLYDIKNSVSGIFVYNLKKLEIFDCDIQSFNGDGIAAYSTESLIAHDNKIMNVNGTGIKGHKVVDMDIYRNIIENTGFIPQQFVVDTTVWNTTLFFPETKFGDGIEGDCKFLVVENNTIINPGRCGIVHDLAKDLKYKNSSARIYNNIITINSELINNGNPPAGMWFEQSAKVNVARNKIVIIKSTSKLVSGIRFYNITDSITCQNNIITASAYNHVCDQGIGIFEPETTIADVKNNTVSGKFKSCISISYEKETSYMTNLRIQGNKFTGAEKISEHGIDIYTGAGTHPPKQKNIKNNTFRNINAEAIILTPR